MCAKKRGTSSTQSPGNKRARAVESQCVFASSDANSIDLSTDPSQNDYNGKCHYKPVTREEWVECLPKRKSKRCNPVTTHNEPVNSNPVQKATKLETLLEKLISLVRPREGKETAVRRVVRELRTTIQCQNEKLTKDCPVGEVCDETRAWCTGASGACSECGMNHFGVALHRLGNQLYGATNEERDKKMTRWFKDGTGEYVRAIRKVIQESWLGKFLTDITVKREVQTFRQSRGFVAVTKTQVRQNIAHAMSHTHKR